MTEHAGGGRAILREELAYKFVDWLSFQPSGSDICRALVTEYCTEHQPYSARISRLNSDDSVTFIGEYGYEKDEAEIGLTVPSQVWRSRPTVAAMIASGRLRGVWSPDGKLIVIDLRDNNAIQGFLSFRFYESVSEGKQDEISRSMLMFSFPLSLYLSWQNKSLNNGVPKMGKPYEILENNHNGPVRLTQRQLQILRGMVEGKTNHDLATDLGFSVSTIRHETMAIYKELAVSDRHEAAKVAISKGLIATAIGLAITSYPEITSQITHAV